MKPEIGDTVKIFINASVIEGKVHKWGKKIILSSDHQDSFMVITKPKDIFMYKITRSRKEELQLDKIALPKIDDQPQEHVYLEEEIPDPYLSSDLKEEDVYVPDWAKKSEELEMKQGVTNLSEEDLDLRGKTLAELHKLKIEEDRKILAQRMKQVKLNPSLGVKYELPSFFKKEE